MSDSKENEAQKNPVEQDDQSPHIVLGKAADEAPEADKPVKSESNGALLAVSREHVEDLLVELAEISQQSGLHQLAREVRTERIPAFQAGRMSVVVLGEFNHGKSTVVNALLGEEILPTGITPTTAVITHLVYGEGARRDPGPARRRAHAGRLREDGRGDQARGRRRRGARICRDPIPQRASGRFSGAGRHARGQRYLAPEG